MLTQPILDASVKLQQWLQACLPLSCLLCQQGVHQGIICQTCQRDLMQYQHFCLQCGYQLKDIHSDRCGACGNQPNDVLLRHGGILAPPISHMLHRLKYDKQVLFAPLLAQITCHQIRQQTPTIWPEVLIPVPLHPLKQWRRGFNQATLLACALGQSLAIPVDNALCKRVKNTLSQTQLGKQERLQNMKRAFFCQPHRYHHLAIIDDIFTTGATANSLAKAIIQNACYADVTIEIWTIARTDLQCSH